MGSYPAATDRRIWIRANVMLLIVAQHILVQVN